MKFRFELDTDKLPCDCHRHIVQSVSVALVRVAAQLVGAGLSKDEEGIPAAVQSVTDGQRDGYLLVQFGEGAPGQSPVKVGHWSLGEAPPEGAIPDVIGGALDMLGADGALHSNVIPFGPKRGPESC